MKINLLNFEEYFPDSYLRMSWRQVTKMPGGIKKRTMVKPGTYIRIAYMFPEDIIDKFERIISNNKNTKAKDLHYQRWIYMLNRAKELKKG